MIPHVATMDGKPFLLFANCQHAGAGLLYVSQFGSNQTDLRQIKCTCAGCMLEALQPFISDSQSDDTAYAYTFFFNN